VTWSHSVIRNTQAVHYVGLCRELTPRRCMICSRGRRGCCRSACFFDGMAAIGPLEYGTHRYAMLRARPLERKRPCRSPAAHKEATELQLLLCHNLRDRSEASHERHALEKLPFNNALVYPFARDAIRFTRNNGKEQILMFFRLLSKQESRDTVLRQLSSNRRRWRPRREFGRADCECESEFRTNGQQQMRDEEGLESRRHISRIAARLATTTTYR
jgi:hypothetical protein